MSQGSANAGAEARGLSAAEAVVSNSGSDLFDTKKSLMPRFIHQNLSLHPYSLCNSAAKVAGCPDVNQFLARASPAPRIALVRVIGGLPGNALRASPAKSPPLTGLLRACEPCLCVSERHKREITRFSQPTSLIACVRVHSPTIVSMYVTIKVSH